MSWLNNKKTKLSKLLAVFFILFFLISSGITLLSSRETKASAERTTFFSVAGDVAGTGAGFPVSDIGLSIWQKITRAIDWAWEHGGAIAYRNAARTFTQQVAYDLAVYVGSGGQGQQPLFVTQGWGAYLKDVGDSAGGDFLDSLARNNGYINLGLCSPVGPGSSRAQLIIGLTAFDEIKPRKPKCSLSDISKNWEAALADPKKFLGNFNVAFDLRQNDLGVALKVRENIIRDQEAKKKITELELAANKGLKNITTPITGAIKTPAAFLEKQFGIGLESASNEPLAITGDVIADALGTFTNTLASRMIKNLFQKGLVPNPGGSGPSSLFGFNTGGIEYAIQVNNSISTPQLVSSDVALDVISELVNCPSDIKYASINNCTIDRKFEQILRKADEGNALTVKEAIQQGFINGGWKFKTTRPSTVRVPDAWYLSDLKKLRKARVVSVGWELAAEKFSSGNVTLQEVVNAFDNCPSDSCKLIDPDWVLRAPPSQCRLQGSGQILDPQGGGRQDTCADVEQCVAEGSDGACQAWGYCLAEKNIWQFSGDSCEFPSGSGYSPYATCQTFTSGTNQISLLTNSLANYDDGVCSGAVGCKWYSTILNNASASSTDRFSLNESDRYYLKNLNQYTCAQNEQGCTAFLRLQSIEAAPLAGEDGNNLAEQLVNKVVANAGDRYTNYASVTSAHLKEAPEYLGCYDTDALGIAITNNDSTLCKNYLKLCSAAEVGCELYSSSEGNPAVPAIIQATDYCPQECVNFNKYYQSPSFFEPADTITADFIPSTARTCTAQAAGCEEFTNLDQSAQGEQREYYSKLQQCIAADDPNAATYFTWVGSDLTGFQLKDWRLQSESPGDDAARPFTASGYNCQGDFGTTNPDCKQFYTLTGYVHYVLASEVVTASTTCSRYRATNVASADCGATNGSWDASLGACIYNAIPGEGQKCQAQYNGCREYKGPNANNVQLVFPVSTFGDQEQIGGLSVDASATSGWSSGVISNESLVAFGHSFSSGPTTNIGRLIPSGVKASNRYLVSFWAKKFPASVAAESSLAVPAGSYTWTVSVPALTDDWQLYKVESNVPAGADLSIGVHLQLIATNQFVIDNITVKNNFDNFYLIKNSWNTPAVCAAGYLGCKAYADRASRQVAATGFSQLCKAEAVGCEPLINTQNSDSPQQQDVDFTIAGYTVTTPADQVVYRVYDQTKACPAAAEACRLVGEPNLSTTGEVTSWGDKLVKLDPDKFDPTNPTSPLCSKTQDRCQEFTQTDGSRHYFKDPGNSLCEYKQVSPSVGYSWYKRGTNEVCNLLTNASFETTQDHGPNLLVNGGFESPAVTDPPTLPPTSWTVDVGSWVINDAEFSQGISSVLTPTAGSPKLNQTFRVLVGQVYTARVNTFAPNASTRNLRVFGCGVDMTDTTQAPGSWQKLQLTFRPTTTVCTMELSSSTAGGGVAGDTYYDDASIFLAETFTNWRRNGDHELSNEPFTNLSIKPSVAGQYWGSQVLEIESTANMYSGVWSNNIDLGKKLDNDQDFIVTAHVYVPDIPQNVGMLGWQLSQHAVPGYSASGACPDRIGDDPGVGETCHHYDYQPYSDFSVTNADKGKWVYKQAIIKADAGVRYLSVGFITNFGTGAGVCTADTCRANQVVYIDQLSITPGIIQPAYTCPANQASCTAFQDPILTKQTYYYLNNNKLDRSSCAGQVGEKDGCLLFSDLSNSNLTWNATATYADSRLKNNSMVTPLTSPVVDTNTILRVNRSRVCGEWLSCQSEALQYDQTGNSKSVCYALGRCDTFGSQGAAKCGNWKTVAEPKPLSLTAYQARGTSWSDKDLSGYSIPGIYPIDTLKQKRYSTDPAAPNVRLTYLEDTFLTCNGTRTEDGGVGCSPLYSTCAGGICLPEDRGLTDDGAGVESQEYPGTAGKLCRLYPEAQAPFPSNLATFKAGGPDVEGGGNIERKNVGYTDANICQPFDAAGNPQSCECSYQRVSYEQGESRYYGLFTQPDLSILVDKANNIKSRISRQDYLLGLRGYCLERDTSRAINGVQDNACLTWLPLDVVSGDISIYDYAPDAGFNNPSIAYYCSAQGAYHQLANGYEWDMGTGVCRNIGTDSGAGVGGYIAYPSTWPKLNKDAISELIVYVSTYDDNQSCGGDVHRSGNYFDLMTKQGYCAAEYHADGSDSSVEITGDACMSGIPDTLYPAVWDALTVVSPEQYNAQLCPEGDTIGARAVFDESDSLLGINIFHCTIKHNSSGEIRQRWPSTTDKGVVIKIKKDYCAELSQVASGIENKAWTNRLLNPSSGFSINIGAGKYDISSDLRPFGAVDGTVNIKTTNIPVYQYTSAVRAASPYSCEDRSGFDCGQKSYSNICVGGDRKGQRCSEPTDGDTTGCGEGGICVGTRFAVPAAITAFEGVKRVQTLFAKLFGIYQLSDTHKGYDEVMGVPIPKDISGSALATTGRCGITGNSCNIDSDCAANSCSADKCALTGESVSCLGAYICGGAGSGGAYCPVGSSFGSTCSADGSKCYYCRPNTCEPSHPQIRRVNQIDTDPKQGGNGFTIVANGTDYSSSVPLLSPAEVTAAFYAYNANGEQMPLREVRVDWLGDPDNASGASGKYKNHKAVCKKPTVPGYNFGDSPQACVDDVGVGVGYFTFNRSLTCSPGGLGLKSCADALPYQACWDENGAGAGIGACVFKPRVYVRDNWDWCFGGPSVAAAEGRWGVGVGGACNLIDAEAWLPFPDFSGQVIVRP